MFNNIFFIGGIHGVGKSTLCKDICAETGLEYLSASSVLNWAKVNGDNNSKNVKDINYTQDLLINGLAKIVSKGKRYLLDGHYCLWDKDGVPSKIPFETFQKIQPVQLGVVIDDVAKIKERIEKRDKKLYEIDELIRFQETEVDYAKELSIFLGVTINILSCNNIGAIIKSIKTHHENSA